MPLDLLNRRSLSLVQRFQNKVPASLPAAQAEMTVFCDFDGPIVDVSGRYHSTYRLALARTRKHFERQGQSLNLTPLSKAEFWQMKQVRIPDVEIAARSGLREEQVEFFLETVKELVNCCPALLRRDVPQPQVSWALDMLQQRNIKLVLVTLRCEAQVRDFLEKHGLQSAFAGIYGTNDAQAAYQNYTDLKTSLLSQAVEEHGTPTQQCMVGDTEADVVAAQRLGVPAIALTCGIRSRTYLEDLKPDAIRHNLLGFAQEVVRSIEASAYALN